ncbi:HNH endonuclease [Catenovulum sp. 2E275]|uniref:HNH endonuclease n=1 Tax=Catenovulum sp. 2E275 TaxID=2980497 RepID=UPI0021D1F44D|nr:HNH endonuclease signature motif containing protein [Catenovulum sp. 2E275]MCU4677732.1 HNH endonuclease [Catenovulum sp. 2E275]
MGRKLAIEDVLKYSPGRKSQKTIRRYYIEWRNTQSPAIPVRCDNPKCFYHLNELVWNGEPLNVILDHINGVNGDNNPKNLQFLCPNCNSQQKTHGGGNKGRVEQQPGGYSTKDDNGKKHYVMPIENAKLNIATCNVDLQSKKT